MLSHDNPSKNLELTGDPRGFKSPSSRFAARDLAHEFRICARRHIGRAQVGAPKGRLQAAQLGARRIGHPLLTVDLQYRERDAGLLLDPPRIAHRLQTPSRRRCPSCSRARVRGARELASNRTMSASGDEVRGTNVPRHATPTSTSPLSFRKEPSRNCRPGSRAAPSLGWPRRNPTSLDTKGGTN